MRGLAIGRVAGHRGASGEITVRVHSGHAGRWTHVENVTLRSTEEDPGRGFRVERSRAYRDRLVLKLADVDTADRASGLRGLAVWVGEDEVPRLPAGVHYQARLIDLEVFDERAGRLGRVADVLEAGGADLLVVREGPETEILVPLSREIVREVDESRGRIEVRLPEGLAGLNAPEGDGR